jgi:hypothetical protein
VALPLQGQGPENSSEKSILKAIYTIAFEIPALEGSQGRANVMQNLDPGVN